MKFLVMFWALIIGVVLGFVLYAYDVGGYDAAH